MTNTKRKAIPDGLHMCVHVFAECRLLHSSELSHRGDLDHDILPVNLVCDFSLVSLEKGEKDKQERPWDLDKIQYVGKKIMAGLEFVFL